MGRGGTHLLLGLDGDRMVNPDNLRQVCQGAKPTLRLSDPSPNETAICEEQENYFLSLSLGTSIGGNPRAIRFA